MAVVRLAAGQDVGIPVAADLDHRGAVGTLVHDQIGVEVSRYTASVKFGNPIDRRCELPPHIIGKCSEYWTWNCRCRICGVCCSGRIERCSIDAGSGRDIDEGGDVTFVGLSVEGRNSSQRNQSTNDRQKTQRTHGVPLFTRRV